jgi:hypothetical protein
MKSVLVDFLVGAGIKVSSKETYGLCWFKSPIIKQQIFQ